MAVELSIIIVNWNGGELLKQCLVSVARQPPTCTYEIIIVDNASSDESVSWIKSDEAQSLLGNTTLELIENRENVGFSKANNQGIARSDAPLILLLNPDTEVLPGAIDQLCQTMRADARIGACGPRLLNSDFSLQHSVWRNPPTAWEIVVSGTGLWRLMPKRLRGELLLGGHWNHAQRREVPMIFGAAILARREMIEAVGGLDERFFMYAEDTEWCLRITRAGWKLVFDPAAEILHHGSQFSLRRWGSEGKLRVQLESYFKFQRYCLPRRQVIANLLAGCAVMSLQKVWRVVRRRPADDVGIVLQLHLVNLKRALRGE
jgi:GT2 family glycosyltransferase